MSHVRVFFSLSPIANQHPIYPNHVYSLPTTPQYILIKVSRSEIVSPEHYAKSRGSPLTNAIVLNLAFYNLLHTQYNASSIHNCLQETLAVTESIGVKWEVKHCAEFAI